MATCLLQVSDIDGTMIGDMSSADVFTTSERFADYWENSASLTGSLLVYNTGGRGRVVGIRRGWGRGRGWGIVHANPRKRGEGGWVDGLERGRVEVITQKLRAG